MWMVWFLFYVWVRTNWVCHPLIPSIGAGCGLLLPLDCSRFSGRCSLNGAQSDACYTAVLHFMILHEIAGLSQMGSFRQISHEVSQTCPMMLCHWEAVALRFFVFVSNCCFEKIVPTRPALAQATVGQNWLTHPDIVVVCWFILRNKISDTAFWKWNLIMCSNLTTF